MALALLPARTRRQPVTHRGFDLVPADADVLQRTVVELLELANSAAPAPFGGEGSCPSLPLQGSCAATLQSPPRPYARRPGSCDCARYGLAARVRRTRAVEWNCLSRTCSDLDRGWVDAALRRGNRRGAQHLVGVSTRERIALLEGALGAGWSFFGDFLEMPKTGRCQGLRRRLRLLRIRTAARICAPAPRLRPPAWS